MVLDGLRGYIQLANGLTDVTRERARSAAKALISHGEASVGSVVPTQVRSQVGALTEDLLATSRANRHLLVTMVRTEVERSVSRLGLVWAQELAAATRKVTALERRVQTLEGATGGATKKSTAKKSTAKKSAKKSTAKKSTAKKSAAKKSTAENQPATASSPTSTTSTETPSGA